MQRVVLEACIYLLCLNYAHPSRTHSKQAILDASGSRYKVRILSLYWTSGKAFKTDPRWQPSHHWSVQVHLVLLTYLFLFTCNFPFHHCQQFQDVRCLTLWGVCVCVFGKMCKLSGGTSFKKMEHVYILKQYNHSKWHIICHFLGPILHVIHLHQMKLYKWLAVALKSLIMNLHVNIEQATPIDISAIFWREYIHLLSICICPMSL